MADPLEYVVVHYPEPVLRKRAEAVESFDAGLQELVEAMYRTMYADQGVGLAAPQVGVRKRVLVINQKGDPGEKDEELCLVNPTIVDRSGPLTKFDEGCLSFPGIYAEVERPDRCRVQAFDPQGKALECEFEGFQSRIVQHEYDHLEGVLLVDRMSPAEKLRNKALLADLVDTYKRKKAAQTAR